MQYSKIESNNTIEGILWEMLQAVPLFQGWDNENQLINIIMVLGSPTKSELLAINKELVPEWSDDMYAIKGMDLYKKCSGTGHTDAIDMLYELLAYDPSKRLSAMEAVKHRFLTANFHDDDQLVLSSAVRSQLLYILREE